MTRRARESFAVMDGTITTFGKQKLLSISRSVAVLLVVIFIGCLIATGFLVHQFSSCSSIATVQTSTLIVYDNPSIDSTTVSVTTPKVTIAPVVSTTQKAEKTDEIKDVRLPRSMRPHSYEIKLIPFIHEGNFTFHGQVTILINVTATSDNITLHADELIIDDVSVSEHLQTEQFHPIKRIALDDKFQFLVIYLDEPVQAGRQYLVNIKYKGELNNLLEGFYRSSYRENNETRWIAATQFQATDARKAFPCFDEPAYKATFEISLGRLKNMTSISNMPKSGNPEPIEGLPNYVWDHYQKSLPMSTYLVAFIVSDFESLSNKTFSIWTRKSALSQTKYGLRIGPEILKFYEEFFGIKFPLPKIDMIGLPDFSAGAMENWGLITYRESVLLYEENVSSKASLQRIAHVIAHELAHQWFGNLVTPVWWSDLWLNEGFATYVEYLGANVVNPHLKELDIFVINELHSALTLDALKSSHQISIQVNDPDEIGDIFDRISYSKGASVLRMMQNFLTMEVFQRGLNVYLSSLMYKNAEQDDLWHTLTVQSHKEKVLDPNVTIKEVMDTWTLQTGYPVVNVERNYEKGSISFHQERFSLDKINQSLVTWWIPLTFRFKNGPTKFIWMPKSTVVNEENYSVPRNSWLLVNINQTGYYRVNYDLSNWNLIISQLQEKNGHLVFDPKNRAQIIDDAMNLASAGYVDYEVALNITKYLRQETEYVPWKAAFTNFDYVYEMMIRTAHFDKLKAYLLNLMEELFTNVGFYENDSDSQLKVYLRTEMYYRSCRLGFRECIINAVQQFQTWRNSLNPDLKNEISKDLRQVVYCTAISVGGQEEWDFLWQRYLNAYVDNEREIFLLALGCSKEVWILSRYLEWAVTPNSNIRKHDAPRVFAAIANNPIGQELSYHFLKTEWGKIRTYLGPSSMALTSLIRSTTKNFNTWIDVNDFKEFLRERRSEFGIALRTAQQSIEQGEANINWMAKNFNKIVQWLESVKL